MIKFTGLETLQAVADEMEQRYVRKENIETYSIRKKETAVSGYAASYQLVKDGDPIGDTINIPKDYLVRSASLKVATDVNMPEDGYVAGDKYIDFIVNTSNNDDTDAHIYLKVSDLVDAYSGGSGVNISGSNVVSVKINSNAANGLKVSSDGLGLDLATESSAGAMSAQDKRKLNSSLQTSDIQEITAEEVHTVFQ